MGIFGKKLSNSNKSPEELDVAKIRKRALKKADFHILPWVYFTYMIVRLDLSNISNAGIMNQEKGHSLRQDLSLSPQQWAWAIACFSYTYAAVEPLSSFGVKLTSPSIWIARIMTSWGIVMACMGAITNYEGLIATRVLLGALEGGYFPCIVYYFAHWYTHEELVPRIFCLYVANASSGAVSGFFAWAVSFGDREEIHGWQILFIVEGLITIICGIVTWFILPDYPKTSKWLSDDERAYIIDHLPKANPNPNAKTFQWDQIKALFKDPTFVLFSMFWLCNALGAWTISTVLPVVVADMGITDSAGTNLLQIPPAFSIILYCCIGIVFVHYVKWSPYLLVILMLLSCIVGFILLIKVDAAGVRYFAACLVNATGPACYAVLWPERVKSLRGTTGAAFGYGLLNMMSQFNGILGPQIYRTDYGPRYFRSFYASSAFIGFAIFVVIALWWTMEGNIQRFPRFANLVQSQTQRGQDNDPDIMISDEDGKGSSDSNSDNLDKKPNDAENDKIKS